MRAFPALNGLAALVMSAGLTTPALSCGASARPGFTVQAGLQLAMDDDTAVSEGETGEGEDSTPAAPGNQTPSEDGTERSQPDAPEFGGCIFEKRDLGLLV